MTTTLLPPGFTLSPRQVDASALSAIRQSTDPPIHRWAEWLDGTEQFLVQGTDFACECGTFVEQVKAAAARRGLAVAVQLAGRVGGACDAGRAAGVVLRVTGGLDLPDASSTWVRVHEGSGLEERRTVVCVSHAPQRIYFTWGNTGTTEISTSFDGWRSWVAKARRER